MESETPITWSPPQENSYEVDYEKYGANRDSNPMPDLKRKLKSRHLQMIAIGKSTTMNTKGLGESVLTPSSQVAQSERVCSLVVELLSPVLAQSALSSHTSSWEPLYTQL